jgi:hypothetical protein
MFGRRAKQKRFEELSIQGGAFMTLAQATVAVSSRHSDPTVVVGYLGSVLLGSMVASGIGPEGNRDERAVWQLLWENLGGPLIGDNWRLAAVVDVDLDVAFELAQLLWVAFAAGSREQVEADAEQVLCELLFGRSDASELDNSERMMSHIIAMSLWTIADDASTGPAHMRADREEIGATAVAVYAFVCSRVEHWRKAREGS